MPFTGDLITEAASTLDYSSYVRQPDGSLLTQSSAQGAVSLDVDSSLTARARSKHAQASARNVSVHTGDGYLGRAAEAPYNRIIAWAAPHLLPSAWIGQAAHRAVIVTLITVAPVAQAHVLLRVDLRHGQAVPRDVHAGGFIEMHHNVITEVAVPIRSRRAAPRWRTRDHVGQRTVSTRSPERASRVAHMIATGRSVLSPLHDYSSRSAFCGYLFACQPHGLASAGWDGVGSASASGVGLALPDSAALVRPRDLFVVGTGQAKESLRGTIAAWTRAGRLDHATLRPKLIACPAGLRVEVTT